jgi:hypothetical protein
VEENLASRSEWRKMVKGAKTFGSRTVGKTLSLCKQRSVVSEAN